MNIIKFVEVSGKDAEELRERIRAIPELPQGYTIHSILATVMMTKDGVSKEEADNALRQANVAHARLVKDLM